MQHISIDPSARADDPELDAARDDDTHEVARDLAYLRCALVNVVLYGLSSAGDRQWTLIDTGIPGMAGRIASAASKRFGEDARPAAIILTHGHFDHVGAAVGLAERWDVPVFAHESERPYLDGTAAYPPPDPAVGGGLMSMTSPLLPRGPVDLGARLSSLPGDGSVPFMPGWRWIHTPGHAPGHISLWRQMDRTLIVGDAFATTAQESAYAVWTQSPEMHGPPMFITPDWVSARASVEQLNRLQPEVVVTGHGRAMRGPDMRAALDALARNFDRIAVPKRGAYVVRPVTSADPTGAMQPRKYGS